MILETVQILSVFTHSIDVGASSDRTCSSCKSKPGCGQHLFAKLLGQRTTLNIDIPQQLSSEFEEGDWVVVGIPENALLVLSVLGYLLPVLVMVLGVTLLQVWADSELILASCALLLLFIAGYFSSRFMKTPYAMRSLKAVYIKKVHTDERIDQVLSFQPY